MSKEIGVNYGMCMTHLRRHFSMWDGQPRHGFGGEGGGGVGERCKKSNTSLPLIKDPLPLLFRFPFPI